MFGVLVVDVLGASHKVFQADITGRLGGGAADSTAEGISQEKGYT